MTLPIPVALIAPDLRFALRAALASPGNALEIDNVALCAYGSLPRAAAVPPYLRFADRDAVLVAEGIDRQDELEGFLAGQIRAIAARDELDDLSTTVIALDAIDHCFREAGLWRGNIYLAGAESLTAVLELLRARGSEHRSAGVVVRELAALELAYLFPVAPRFRTGVYDGQVQFRLNGWGRALAKRIADTERGAERAAASRQLIHGHLAAEFQRYESFLSKLDVARQHYDDDRLAEAQSLPIPVLV